MAMAAAVIVPLGLLFFISGLLVNLLQAICYVLIRPLSKNTYRKINRVLAETLWLELVWIVDWWQESRSKCLLIMRRLIEWAKNMLLSFVITEVMLIGLWDGFWPRSGCLGSTLAVTKKSSKFLPVIGWSMWFAEYLFLERNWANDENTIKSGVQRLDDFPRPFWLALFVEGTRFTEAKLKAAQEGLCQTVSNMRSFVPAVYDMTVAIPKTSPSPTILRLFKGQSFVVHVHIKCHSMKDLPESDEAIAQWCIDQFVAKDTLLDKHIAADTFPGQQEQNIGRSIKSLAVVLSWACLLTLGAVRFLHWSNLFSSRKGMALSALCLGIITLCMQILIHSSQSDLSTPAKVVQLAEVEKEK